MFLPSLRLIRLLLVGAPLWLLAAVVPGLWMPGAAWLIVLAGLCLREAVSGPRAADLAARRELPARFSYDEPHPVTLYLGNQSAVDLRVTVRDELPEALETDSPLFDTLLPAGGEARITYHVRPVQRGIHPYGDVILRLEHGFGLLQREVRLRVEDRIKVYPRFRGVDDYQLLARVAMRDEVVRRPRRIRGQGSDYESLRPYVPGDDPRLIDWKASARRGGMISRNPQVEKGQQLAILIDTGRLMEGAIGGHTKLEHAMNAAVRLAYVVQKRGDALAVAAFASQVEAFLPSVRGHEIMPRVLETLCPVQLRPVESDYWQVTAEVMGLLRRRSLVILFTDVLDASGSRGLINNMRRAASRHLVMCVVMIEPRIEEAANLFPETEEEAWRKAAACDLLRRRRLALEHMKSHGILVLETTPDQLSVQLIRRYLEIRQADLQ